MTPLGTPCFWIDHDCIRGSATWHLGTPSAPLGTHPTDQCPVGQLDTPFVVLGINSRFGYDMAMTPSNPPRLDPVRGGLGTEICARKCTYFHAGWGRMLPQHM